MSLPLDHRLTWLMEPGHEYPVCRLVVNLAREEAGVPSLRAERQRPVSSLPRECKRLHLSTVVAVAVHSPWEGELVEKLVVSQVPKGTVDPLGVEVVADLLREWCSMESESLDSWYLFLMVDNDGSLVSVPVRNPRKPRGRGGDPQ